MIRAIMNGCHGVMGHVITDIISKDDAIEIVAGVDMNTENYAGYPVFKSLDECPEADRRNIFHEFILFWSIKDFHAIYLFKPF